jgi:Family of unknown function (DUF5519)
MKLADKGPVIAPPVLAGWAQQVSLEVQSWPAMVSATHWQFGDPTVVDGADFYVAESELGHIHLEGTVHLWLPRTLNQAIVAARLARPFRWDTNFVQVPIVHEASVQHALWLFRLGYDRINGTPESDLLQRVELAASTELVP